MLASWLRIMPITVALVYVGTTFKGLSGITQGWNEVSTTQWVFLFWGFGISGILLLFITKIARASIDTELTKHAHVNKKLNLQKRVTARVDPMRED